MTDFPLEGFHAVALRVARALDAVGARYLVGGSVATSLLGEPRATNDIDFLVELREPQVSELAARLGPDFSVDEEAVLDAMRRGRSWNIFYLPLVTKVDLFFKASAFDESELQRRRFVPVVSDAEGLYVATPEDLIVKKLAWFRSGGEVSTSQWRDVLGVLAVSRRQLDERYMASWATQLGVSDLLQRALEEART